MGRPIGTSQVPLGHHRTPWKGRRAAGRSRDPLHAASGLLAERRLGLAIGGLFGLPIGLLSGFTGVGGGEYRAPVLLVLLGRVRWAIAANLFIGLSVGLFNVIFRQAWTLPVQYLGLALLFVPSSLPGAYFGPRTPRSLPTRAPKGLYP